MGIDKFWSYDGVEEYNIVPNNFNGAVVGVVYGVVSALVRLATLGRWGSMNSDMMCLAVKQD